MGRLSCFAKGMLKCRRVFLLLPFLHLRCLLIRAVMASPNNMLSVVDLILMAVSGVLMDWNVKETSGGNLANLLLLLILVRKVSLRPTGSVAGLVLMAANSVTVGWTVLSSMLTCFVWLLIHVRAVVPPKVVNNVVALVSLDAVTARLSCFAKEMLKCRRVFLLLPFLHCQLGKFVNTMVLVVRLIQLEQAFMARDLSIRTKALLSVNVGKPVQQLLGANLPVCIFTMQTRRPCQTSPLLIVLRATFTVQNADLGKQLSKLIT